uniref:Inactive N-acetylated-alpha-linked acidic dipeptidase-like protein 2 isoform X2 n=1 Tax=Geotrypetes seraphini TaxID=260995 RepID=A0A6P8SAD9_GEOSA|nr:inactive N-acetylated-alpha-linked acidic dipeptidase-like protein 2 isoform X2 [Geotrypetes seraphini]
MGENEAVSLQGSNTAHPKVHLDRRMTAHTEYLDGSELHSTALEEWDMETELEDLGSDHFQSDNSFHQPFGKSENTDLSFRSFEPSVSPKGRFQRLQDDPDYLLHCSRPVPKKNNLSFCQICKISFSAIFLFITGLLIGYYAKKDDHTYLPANQTTLEPPLVPHDIHSDQTILQSIKEEEIKKIFRNFTQSSSSKNETDFAKELMAAWSLLGLTEVQMLNYSVLLELPGSSPNTITETKSGQCFYPSGRQCDTESKDQSNQDLLHSYAAYSAKGSLELSLLEEAGFGGVLLYVDPCDLPKTSDAESKSFLVALNSGGDPTTPGYSSVDGIYRQNQSNLTSLLVQPISLLLVKTLFSLSNNDSGHECLSLDVSRTEKIQMTVQTVPVYKTISNIVGYLKGSIFPDKYVIVGSRHNTLNTYGGQDWASSTAIITAFLQAMLLQVKKGWRPDRTIVFCSWGGTAFGNIGSYEWAEGLKRVLQRNAVAYVNLHNPVRGTSVLHPIASPSLQQLATEILNFSCMKALKCEESNVSSVQMQGDADYFINHLGIPTVEFVYEDNTASEKPSFLSEAIFPVDTLETEKLDPSFMLHTTIAKLTAAVVLKIANEPVLPFNALDIGLEVQTNLLGDSLANNHMLAMARSLRDSAQLFQSNEMRPANNPKERDPIRVRMLNDVLQHLEKNFLTKEAPLGFYRNILYRLDEKTTQFSILMEAQEHWKLQQSNEIHQAALSKVLNTIHSAQVYFKAGFDVFETALDRKH